MALKLTTLGGYSLNRLLLILFILLLFQKGYAQIISGKVVDARQKPLQGVVIVFLESQKGTTSESDGSFLISRTPGENHLIIRYTGYQSDTIELQPNQNEISLQLTESIALSEVSITGQERAHTFSLLQPHNVESVQSVDFRKAACCSLAESFQSGNTVDLAYNNAIVGNREIQMLGLRGIYTQQLIENRPVFTGLISAFGYDFIPGTWLDEINIQKGASSALHGSQSMTGAINAALKKPDKDDRFFANGYLDYHGRAEANIHLNRSWSAEDHSGIYLHASRHAGFRDHNKDGFYDDAQNTLLDGMMRNIFYGHQWEGQLNLQALYNTRTGGQTTDANPYLFNQIIRHVNLSGNLGYVGFRNQSQNTGSIYDFSYSTINSNFGLNKLEGYENHFLVQLIYNLSFADDRHSLTIGPAINFNQAEEISTVGKFPTRKFNYREMTPGIIGEYNFRWGTTECADVSRFVLSTSQRIDYIKNQKLFWSPRASMKYQMNDIWTARLSVGRGFRFNRIVTDNLSLLATNREWVIDSIPEYESSWNYGFNMVGKPTIRHRETEFNIDAYVTQFDNQLVVDLDQTYGGTIPAVTLLSLNGISRAISISGSFKIDITQWLSLKTGARWQDNRQQLISAVRQQVFIPQWRGLLSADLSLLHQKLEWNITSHAVGKSRLPDKRDFPHYLIHEHDKYSKPFLTIQSQATYHFAKGDIYAGCENITNYTQHQAIIDAGRPDSPYFSANELYAPINGIKPYIGFRFHLN